MHETPPCGPSGNHGALLVDVVPVKLTAASVDVHLSGAEPSLALPEVASEPEGANNKDGEVGLEEVGGSTSLLALG